MHTTIGMCRNAYLGLFVCLEGGKAYMFVHPIAGLWKRTLHTYDIQLDIVRLETTIRSRIDF